MSPKLQLRLQVHTSSVTNGPRDHSPDVPKLYYGDTTILIRMYGLDNRTTEDAYATALLWFHVHVVA